MQGERHNPFKDWRQYKLTLLVYPFFILVMVVAFFAGQANPSNLQPFVLTRAHPWGIMTYAFVHFTAAHIIGNLELIVPMWCVYLLWFSSRTFKDTRKADLVCAFLPLVASTIGGAIFFVALYVLNGYGSTQGSSGVAYAMLGVALVTALFGTAEWLQHRRPDLSDRERKRILLVSAAVLAIYLPIVLLSYVNSSIFLGSPEQVNTFVHGTSFVIGVVGSYIFWRAKEAPWRS